MAEAYTTIECLTFDLEKMLPLPRIPTNVVYYKRQLMLYNCGVHSGSNNKGYCYCWLEGETGQHLLEEFPEFGYLRRPEPQYKNNTAIKGAPHPSVYHPRFLISGHSFLPYDSDFGDIESALKN
ncbi:hypothetical protein PR048_012737 [Dryococelus australis]|uniref:Uncharacterized protein n=1 Tax=Dryococelus australis TaxID=614101 RepID=A0ABQ9HQC2_9NEOP|nr:hypothetical protein PR048_012737 [Dryococelus australis]